MVKVHVHVKVPPDPSGEMVPQILIMQKRLNLTWKPNLLGLGRLRSYRIIHFWMVLGSISKSKLYWSLARHETVQYFQANISGHWPPILSTMDGTIQKSKWRSMWLFSFMLPIYCGALENHKSYNFTVESFISSPFNIKETWIQPYIYIYTYIYICHSAFTPNHWIHACNFHHSWLKPAYSVGWTVEPGWTITFTQISQRIDGYNCHYNPI